MRILNGMSGVAVVAGVLALSVAVSTANAAKVSYTLGDESAVVANTGSGLLIQTQVHDLAGLSFDLNDGEQFTFDFFNIWTPETDVAQGEDTEPRLIVAALEFDSPDVDVPALGVTAGVRILHGILQAGVLKWSAPAVVQAGDSTFSVTLEDLTFNGGLLGLWPGECQGGVVRATVQQISSVPTPTAIGGGLALLGLLMVKRRMAA